MNYRQFNKGFTLVELLIVMILIGIVATMVMIGNPTESIKVDNQAKRLASDLRYMQHLAMTQNTRTRVNFSSTQYTLTEADGTTAINQPTLNTNIVAMPAGITLSNNLPSSFVVFDSLGQPYSTAVTPGTLLTTTATITLTSGSDTETVSITPETGRVTIP